MKLKLIAVGGSTGFVLPDELLEKLGVRQGDELHVIDTPDGFRLSRSDAEFDRQLDVAQDVMRRRQDLLRKLAE